MFFLEESNVLSVCLDIYLTRFIKSENVCILCELGHWALSEAPGLPGKKRLPIWGISVSGISHWESFSKKRETNTITSCGWTWIDDYFWNVWRHARHYFYYYLIIMLLAAETLNKSNKLTQNSVWRWNVLDFNSGDHQGHSSTCVFWMRPPPHTRQLFLSLNRIQNKERSSTSAVARADTKTYVLFRSRAVKGAFREGTKRWGGTRSARHYHLPPASLLNAE